MDHTDMTEAIHTALDHMYDLRYLQSHPLAADLAGDNTLSTRGEALHQILRSAIERLRPPPETPDHVLSWRPYRYLTLRYVHVLSLQQVSAELGITERHCRRVHREALSALVSTLLASRSVQTGENPDAQLLDGSPDLAAELVEVGVIHEPPASLREVVCGVTKTLQALATASQITLRIAGDFDDHQKVDRVISRQILLNLLLHVIRNLSTGQISIGIQRSSVQECVDVAFGPVSEAMRETMLAKPDEHFCIARHLAQLRGASIAMETGPMEYHYLVSFPRPRSRTVLLIDDNPDFLRFFRRCLARSDYQVIEASNGDEALGLAQERQPNVVMLDVLLPGRDGWEILQSLRNHRRTLHIPIVVCSVLQDRDLALSLGANAFLMKPPSPAKLLDVLERCSGRQARQNPAVTR